MESSNTEFIETVEDLKENTRTLIKYLSSKDFEKNKSVKDLVRKGRCFVIFETENGKVFFPSKFLGYKNNTPEKHDVEKSNGRDGRKTNSRITQILHCNNTEDSDLNAELQKFCESLNVQLCGKDHSFWHFPISLDGK